MNSRKHLNIGVSDEKDGFSVIVGNKSFKVGYPEEIWSAYPEKSRSALIHNISFGQTHFLPLILGYNKIKYEFPVPILESFMFKNQLYDLFFCEKSDNTKQSAYVKKFYNLELEFEKGESIFPELKVKGEGLKIKGKKKPVAIIPFSFGKESLASMALCLELGIEPILVYCQEPSQPYEEGYKIKLLKQISEEFGVKTHFIKNGPGLFRYGKAFGINEGTEIGWGNQTTLLALMSIPFAHFYGAKYILFGSENANNEYSTWNGWKLFPSYDQTSFWTKQQDNMVRILTNGMTGVHSSLEPIEEINIFYLLHHRYPKIGKFQFSCSAEKPLMHDSQWCHKCYKCVRMYLFALACGVDPKTIGFHEDLLKDSSLLNHYFGKEYKTGAVHELDFTFCILSRKKSDVQPVKLFNKMKLPKLPHSWKWYINSFTKLHTEMNLPPEYRDRMMEIFGEELESFKNILP